MPVKCCLRPSSSLLLLAKKHYRTLQRGLSAIAEHLVFLGHVGVYAGITVRYLENECHT